MSLGARKRTAMMRNGMRSEDEGKDSGVSSENATPMGSPAPRQQQPRSLLLPPTNVAALIAASRARLEKTR